MSDGNAQGPGSGSSADVARLLRQRVELGGDSLFMGGLTREEALKLAAAAERGVSPAVTASAPRIGSDKDSSPRPVSEPAKKESSRARRPAATVAAPRSTSAALPVLPDSYDELREAALACTRCELAESRTQVVFSDGAPTARLVVVGEAPGANEDKTGVPFVGAAGKYLDLLLATVALSREESVYICNVLKCRPPANRNPMPEEISACSGYLHGQIELVKPRALLAVGSFAAQLLTGNEKTALGRLRGEVHSYRGVPLVVTYHPAALLRNPKWTRPFWDDLQLLSQVMNDG